MPTLLKGYLVFVPAQLINFSVIPEHHRFAFVGGVRVLWSKQSRNISVSCSPQSSDTYLSLVNARVEAQIAARKGLAEPSPAVTVPRPDRID